MRAIRLYEFGPAGNLRYEEVEDPQAGPGQVRIAVKAAGVHLLDTAVQAGEADGLPFPLPDLPVTPGREVAGIVDQVGEGVDAGWLGRRVVTHLGLVHAGYAELAVREVEALFEVPATLDFGAAVAMVGTGRTALAIHHVGAVTPEDVVLVTAAAGGVGLLLVQAAKAAGATVVGVAGGAAKVARVRAAGADVAVDYSAPGWSGEVSAGLGGRAVTAVFDGVGGRAGREAFELLGFGGRMVLFGWSAGTMTELTTRDLFDRMAEVTVALGPRLVNVPGGLRAMQEKALAEAAAGRLVPAVQGFPLAEAARAHTELLGRGTTGKVVLVPES
ncbi:zinc-binding dehydrogenase [Spirillospora sp. NPDC047279]|uniref:zinc-binding dehydrogenase n=1 Tax=Spirillospora sp. NPDC047279 TaxID=3155478 RepID=UPI0033CC9734